jgi:hypothetical protein
MGAMALGLTLVLSGCANEQGESRRALGTGDGNSLEESNYEMTEGNDSTVSGAATTSALKADTAADPGGEVRTDVSAKYDTSESYSSVNGRSSTSNVGTSVSINENRPSNNTTNPKQLNQTPAAGSDVTTTDRKVPLKPSGTQSQGSNRVQRPSTENVDPNGRPIQNGQVQPANESGNKDNYNQPEPGTQQTKQPKKQ